MKRVMEGSSVLLCKWCAPWQGLLLTGKYTYSLIAWGVDLRGRMESPVEEMSPKQDSRLLFAVMVQKVQ